MSRQPQPKNSTVSSANPLFCQWLKEWKDEAASKGSQSKSTYARALQSLNKFPLPLSSGKDCMILKNFGKKICDSLDKKLLEYRSIHGEPETNIRPLLAIDTSKPKRKAKKKTPDGLDQQPGPSRKSLPSSRGVVSQTKRRSKVLKITSLKVARLKTKTSEPLNDREDMGNEATRETTEHIVSTKPLEEYFENGNIYQSCPASPKKTEVIPSVDHKQSEPEVIDLSQLSDTETDLVSLTDRLTNEKSEKIQLEENNPKQRKNQATKSYGGDDDDEDDCIIISDNINCDRLLESLDRGAIETKTTEMKSEIRVQENKRGELTEEPIEEDSFLELLAKPVSVASPKNDSILDISAEIRRKRRSFLRNLTTQPPQTLQEDVLPQSFLSSQEINHGENSSPIRILNSSPVGNCNEGLSPEPVENGLPTEEAQNGYISPSHRLQSSVFDGRVFDNDNHEKDVHSFNTSTSSLNGYKKSVKQNDGKNAFTENGTSREQEKQKTENQNNLVVLDFDDSDDELLIPLSQRLRQQQQEKPPPTNDSFADLIENVDTPVNSRKLQVTENVASPTGNQKLQFEKNEDVQNPNPSRKRVKKATTTVEEENIPKKKPRTKKDKVPAEPVASTQAFKLRYVPEGSRLPQRVKLTEIISSPSKCPQKILFKPGTFDIVLCVDSCEATGGVSTKNKEAMIKALSSSGIKMEIRKMNVGDFAWIAKRDNDELVLDCIVERKRTDDLAASLKDGRYSEQKHRLLTSGIKQKIYLIEECNRFVTGGISDQALLQAQMTTQVVNDFIVKSTKNVKDSAGYLATLTRALELKYKNLQLRSCLKEEAQKFDNHLMTWQEFNEASYKQKKVCTREMFIRALMVHRRMSLERALTIVTVYPTVTALLQAFEECELDKQKDNLLADLKCPLSGKRIGPALSKSIRQMFIND